MKRSARDVLDQEFLQVRAKLLEVAAFFDRLDGASAAEDDAPQANPRQLELLQQGGSILTDGQGDKAARLQLLFSRDYEPAWREKFNL